MVISPRVPFTRSQQRSALPGPPQRSAQRKLSFESLESRALLAAGPLDGSPSAFEQADSAQLSAYSDLPRPDCVQCSAPSESLRSPAWPAATNENRTADGVPASLPTLEIGEGESGDAEFTTVLGGGTPAISEGEGTPQPDAGALTNQATGSRSELGGEQRSSWPVSFPESTLAVSRSDRQPNSLAQRELSGGTVELVEPLHDGFTPRGGLLEATLEGVRREPARTETLELYNFVDLLSDDLLVALARPLAADELAAASRLGSVSAAGGPEAHVETNQVETTADLGHESSRGSNPPRLSTAALRRVPEGAQDPPAASWQAADDGLIALSHNTHLNSFTFDAIERSAAGDRLKTDDGRVRYQAFELAAPPPATRTAEVEATAAVRTSETLVLRIPQQ